MDDLRHLIDRHLDGDLSAAETAVLDGRLAEDPAAAPLFVRSVLLHDRLADLFRAGHDRTSVTPYPAVEAAGAALAAAGPGRRWVTAAALVGLLMMAGLFARQAVAPAWAASGTLERAVAAATAPVDREYVIRVLDHGPEGPPDPVPSGRGGRQPGIDGGRLFVRGGDAFVLVRRFADGSLFVNGSDGTIGWSVPPRGNVHLSHDPRRFRRSVPGERDEIPFLDLRSGLDGLRRGYRLSVGGAAGDGADAGLQVLEARRGGHRGRGPELVRLWIDTAGVPRRIELHGIPTEKPGLPAEKNGQPTEPEGPRAVNGGATVVALELVAETDLGPDFFDHRSHHALDRSTDWE